MPTLRELCSDIQDELKANNIDDRYSFRFLISRIKDKIRNFIKQDADNRRILKLTELWHTFPIIHMEEVSYINYNIDIPDMRMLMKSKTKLSKTFSTNYGDLLKVFTISGDIEYRLTTKVNYKDILNLEFRNKSIKYYWVEDDYIYIPDSKVEELKLIGLPENPTDLDCDPCARPLDAILSFPSYLIDIVKKDILNELLNSKRVAEDANPNLNPNVKV